MALQCVTITGADDSIFPNDLLAISEEYPFVEWGILVSAKQSGTNRFPSPRWISDLQKIAETSEGLGLNLSLHVCGRWVRDLAMGKNTIPADLLHCFRRVQLNFHAEMITHDLPAMMQALRSIDKELIFQIDGNHGLHFLTAYRHMNKWHKSVPLFDLSHGAGVLPNQWPQPIFPDVAHGYAGGLGPDNLAEQLPLIDEAACGVDYWVDMETRVRSENDRMFDAEKVLKCLDIGSKFIKGS